ncbi:hypothetical protein KSP40_PGU021095 [Platanthera guangdongensis]|uniref:DUF632 domain-containing protein n=1 Tax=Platanthera guangdongensis TaxID=2320717 RepID=A0ABR2M6N9_9ASPA
MGCASSKADDLPLVTLCRERRELLRAAAGHRYVLAAAHASYFRALDRVGDALHRFVAEELVTGPASNYYYTKAAPTMASTVYHHPHVEQWSNAQEERFGYGFGYGYGYPSFTQDDAYSYEPPGVSGGNEAPIAPPSEEQRLPPQTPPPPPPQESSWDFFNPFDSYEQIFDRYAQSSFRLGSVASSPNSSEVREQEGIPDLEEETEHEYVEEKGKQSNLSSTLEQLYMWEKKLYKEVKDEEKLRFFYDREYTRLKALDGRGAESGKIDATRVTINKLTTKISITIKSVYAISRRIHKLRDEELRPQLVELIHGLIRMWSSMLDCHQRQFQAIFEASSQKFLFKSIPPQSLPTKATSELEIELMNWCTCFSNWIRAQKAYIESLNGWLMKWLLHEKEDTPNGITPFSPSKIGAPAIFIVSNDWHHIIEKTSEDEVLAAMHSFATNLHRLCESQDEEQRQKLKAEYLSKDFERRLKALQKQKMENEHPCEPHIKITVSAPDNNIPDLNGGMVDLDLMQKRLDEEKAKHVNAMKQIHEVASCSLKTGLIPIFEALEDYSSETLKLYCELRLPESNGL